MRITALILGLALAAGVSPAGAQETERFSRTVRLGSDGRVSVANIAGSIVVTAGSGSDVSIEAVKRTSGGRSELAAVVIDVEERPGRVDVRVSHTAAFGGLTAVLGGRTAVDFAITVPSDTAVDVKSVSGDVTVRNVRGAFRAETVSGGVSASGVPRVERAKSVSGDLDLADVNADGDLAATTVSGDIRVRSVKARSLQVNTVSGDVTISDAACERLEVKSMSGDLEFSGQLTRSGRYDVSSHSGSARLTLTGNTGFELAASTFSGSVRSDVPLTIRDPQPAGDRRSLRGTYGDGSAVLNVGTFSGNITITGR